MLDFVEEFRKLDTATVSDAMDKIGIECALHGIKPIDHKHKICGKAFTVAYMPCGLVKGTVGDFIDDVKEGEVVVIDNDGRTDCTVWGDIMSFYAKEHNIEATVIDGVCRDVPTIRELDYPIYSKGYYMRTGKDRVEVRAVNEDIQISDIRVKNGDIILGDASGVIVIPFEKCEEVLEIANSIHEKESQIEAAIKNGSSLKEAREKFGYHKLQTKEN
ncbi:RraA family protein [Anaerococcus sp. Marseille-Q7828]|uniref:RraA family protein n=1 Tax=Anaerococcus sp. Marseille-Q7828 TaxID=3036300 RepID=UPI0024AE1247|nr:RraA family protein [Anaerococcus sp. Marseille-Q7828]